MNSCMIRCRSKANLGELKTNISKEASDLFFMQQI